jgi:aminoglycoside phosphotransferase (APT) family kinase protein
MSVAYSTIKTFSEPEAIQQFLAERVIGPVLPSVQVTKVRTTQGRRFEAPRILWNAYEADLLMPDGTSIRRLFWTKAFFEDSGFADFVGRAERLVARSTNPLDPNGFAQIIPDLNLFLFFFPADPVFGRLPTVVASDQIRPVLAEHFERLRPGVGVESLNCVRIKYLPEISCIVKYEGNIGEERPLSIYGKVQHSRRGQLTYDVMRALWDLPAHANGELVLAEPLAYYPRLELLLQSELPGEEIASDRHSEVFMAQCEAAGRTIAHIHNSGIDVGAPHSVSVEIDRLSNRLGEFKMSGPRVYFLLRDLLNHIRTQAEKIPAEDPVPSHGDFKYNQFLYDGTNFGLIDVEYFVQAEPSFDLGKYCGHLAPSKPKHWSDTAQANEGRRVFLDAYCRVRPNYRGARFPIYEALSLATRALVVLWSQSRDWQYTAETLVALGFERLKTRWGE